MEQEKWAEAQQEEKDWWGTCQNTFGEEMKQLTYAAKMGIKFTHNGYSPYNIISDASILDIGGGPSSLALKVIGSGEKLVIDPCEYPEWVKERYSLAGIGYTREGGETYLTDYHKGRFDEVWLYNVLQHTHDPRQIIQNIYDSLKPGGVLRMFEWIDTQTNAAHPHKFSIDDYQELLSSVGFDLAGLDNGRTTENGAKGQAAYGVLVK